MTNPLKVKLLKNEFMHDGTTENVAISLSDNTGTPTLSPISYISLKSAYYFIFYRMILFHFNTSIGSLQITKHRIINILK